MRLLQAGRVVDALAAARKAVAQGAECSTAHGFLATVLLQSGDREEAEIVITQALDRPAGSADAYDALAFVSIQLGEHIRANELYRRATDLAPRDARHWYNLASSERSLGRLEQAEVACTRAISIDRHHYQSYNLRSELRTQTESSNHIEEMERLLADSAVQERAVMFLGYALGKELDDLKRFADAFKWFERAATARRRHLSYNVAVDVNKLERIARTFSGPRSTDPQLSDVSSGYVFVLGMPRSGTTLVERMLTRLPRVRSNGETENLQRALSLASNPSERDVFLRFAAADPRSVSAHYRRLAGNLDAGIVIEKLPLNYLYLGSMARALPGASPVVVTRGVLDGCFAMYRTLFGGAYPFSYDLRELGVYYAAYTRLMTHWRGLFGDWVTEVRYEDVVTLPKTEGRRLAEAIGTAWTDEAADIEKNTQVSMTASASQVRRPIYRSSVGRWRNYRDYLSPLITALQGAGVHCAELSE